MVLALIHAYDLTAEIGSERKYLDKAMLLYDDIMSAWDSTCCGVFPGGIWWDRDHSSKATASNAGPALAGAMLYERTGQTKYRNFAQKVFDFWYTNMVDVRGRTYQVSDSICSGNILSSCGGNGSLNLSPFTYNEGLMIGAAVELSVILGSDYLTKAHNIAGFILRKEVHSTPLGDVLVDFTDDCRSQGNGCSNWPGFKGVGDRYLMRLYQTDTSKSQYLNILKSSADAVWNLARNGPLTLFAVNWAGPPEPAVQVLQETSAITALSRYAQLAGSYTCTESCSPTGQYEAENATIQHVGLESSHSGFSGWGYVAGWNGGGQVDFKIGVPNTGRGSLAFHYSAGAGDASRVISVNRRDASANLRFGSTGSWDKWNTVTLPVNFLDTAVVVSVIFDTTKGSSNYLNLDNVTVMNPLPPRTVAAHLYSPPITLKKDPPRGPRLPQTARGTFTITVFAEAGDGSGQTLTCDVMIGPPRAGSSNAPITHTFRSVYDQDLDVWSQEPIRLSCPGYPDTLLPYQQTIVN